MIEQKTSLQETLLTQVVPSVLVPHNHIVFGQKISSDRRFVLSGEFSCTVSIHKGGLSHAEKYQKKNKRRTCQNSCQASDEIACQSRQDQGGPLELVNGPLFKFFSLFFQRPEDSYYPRRWPLTQTYSASSPRGVVFLSERFLHTRNPQESQSWASFCTMPWFCSCSGCQWVVQLVKLPRE